MGKTRNTGKLATQIQFDNSNNLVIGNSTSSSFNTSGSVNAIGGITGSIFGIGDPTSFSASISSNLVSIQSVTASNIARLSNLESKSASVDISITNINSITASNIARLNNLETKSASVDITISSINSKTGSYATTGSNTFVGTQIISGSTYVQGDLVVLGSSSIQYISASSVSIGTNIVQLNTATPGIRFAGLAVQDSGSSAGITGSMLWDSLCNRWIYSNPSTIGYSGGMLMSGPRASTLGSESPLTCNYIVKSGGGDHLYDSCIWEMSGSVGIGITPNITAGITELAIGSANTNPLISGIRDGACAFSLSSDSAGTKLFERRNLELTIGTNNTTRMYITNGGNVGIAVNPPAWRTTDKVLQVNNSALFDENGTNLWLGLNFYENSCGNYIFNNNGFATAYRQDTGTHKFFISNNGTAGCTVSLSTAFQIASTGAATFGSSLTINGAVNVNGGSAININAQNCFQVGADASSGGFYVYDNCAGVYRFKIANGGGATFSSTVAIGTTLTTSGNITANSSTIYAGSNNTTRIQMNADTIEGYYGASQYWGIGRDSWGSGCAALALGGTSRYALIGADTNGNTVRIALGATIGNGAVCTQHTFQKGAWSMLSSSEGTNFSISYGSGKTTIGMDSGGTCGIFFNMYSGGYADRFYVLSNGNYYHSGTNVSDIRTKENICIISMNAINKLSCLVAKSFNTIGHPDQKRYGFIAQEVRNILPDIVSGNEETETIGLDYNSILSLTVKAIQEQQCTINLLKSCIGIV